MVGYQSPGVYLEELPSGSRPIEGVGTAVAAFVGVAETGPFNRPLLITNWSQFQATFGGFVADSFLAHSIFGYFINGGGAAYVVRIGADGTRHAARGELPSATDAGVAPYRIAARDDDGGDADVTVEVKAESPGVEDPFTVVVRRGADQEVFENLTTKTSPQNIVTVVNQRSNLISIEEQSRVAIAKRRPAAGVYTLTKEKPPAPVQLSSEDYIGDVDKRTGFGGLQEIDEITMLCVPDLMAAYKNQLIDLEAVQAVQQAMMDHCALMADRVAILDPPPTHNPQQIKEWRVEKTKFDSPFATMYWPWIKVLDPSTGKNKYVPPSGHIAGVWARTDATRGVHKAPANEVVRGVIDVETQVTRAEHDLLNPEGINVIRSFPGRGIRVWGARTLSSDSTWRYLNVRRLFNYLEESILESTDWAVFEPNDLDLWQRLKRTVSAFLLKEWRNGALFGATPEQAFYVKCDEETNPPDVREAGQVVIEVGIAPTKPAEFVVFRVQQVIGNGKAE